MDAVRSLLGATILLIVGLGAAPPAPAKMLPPSVLIIDQSDGANPFWWGVRAAIRSKLNVDASKRVAVYEEYLDLNRFRGPRHEDVLSSYIRDKYTGKPIDVIVTLGSTALEYALRLRAQLGTEVPIVFAMIEDEAEALLKSEPNVTGTMSGMSLYDMVEAARAVVPDLQQIVLVGDPYERQTTRRHYRRQSAEIAKVLQISDLTGLAVSDLRTRVATLPPRSAILYTSIYVDGDGVNYIPREALAILAQTANRPIIIEGDTGFGYGGIGGFVLSPKPVGEAAAVQALRVLAGESASEVPVLRSNFRKPVFDWRQLERWNVNERRLPLGSEVRFRPQGMWEQYRWQLVAIAAALLLQAGIIAALLVERRRRRAAELTSRGRLLEVLHLNRTATAGLLSASFAHEINQPLGAILRNAEAAELFMQKSSPDLDEIRTILADIRKDDQRAGAIIDRMRALLKRHDLDTRPLDVGELVRDVAGLVSSDAAARRVKVEIDVPSDVRPVRGDRVHLQQVLLNLILNGMDALDGELREDRRVSVTARPDGARSVHIAVNDTGDGIPANNLAHVFDSFYTTKPNGMGMGLSISRAIIEAHGGKLWAENSSGSGATFHFTLPTAEETAVP
jgi:signal transduction histidine kinase